MALNSALQDNSLYRAATGTNVQNVLVGRENTYLTPTDAWKDTSYVKLNSQGQFDRYNDRNELIGTSSRIELGLPLGTLTASKSGDIVHATSIDRFEDASTPTGAELFVDTLSRAWTNNVVGTLENISYGLSQTGGLIADQWNEAKNTEYVGVAVTNVGYGDATPCCHWYSGYYAPLADRRL